MRLISAEFLGMSELLALGAGPKVETVEVMSATSKIEFNDLMWISKPLKTMPRSMLQVPKT